ncbi:hypothetical protein XELAEV_18002331mg [Xenopus laevis]|nr:hypothetical protein XELAEV_18002331mg [Xenopus laevis]
MLGVSVPCVCSASGLMLQSDWFPHSVDSPLIPIDTSLSDKLVFGLHPMIGLDVLVSSIDSETVIILKSERFPSSHESSSSFISSDISLSAKLLFRLPPMIGVGGSVLCICSVSSLILQSDWLSPLNEAGSSSVFFAGRSCPTRDISGFVRFPSP